MAKGHKGHKLVVKGGAVGHKEHKGKKRGRRKKGGRRKR